MNGDDQRDYDEERANAQIDRDEVGVDFPFNPDTLDEPGKLQKDRKEAYLLQLRAFADRTASLHYWVATNVNADISAYTSNTYQTTQRMLKQAIRHAYPELRNPDIEYVYDIWVDCGESISYCVDAHKEMRAAEAAERAAALAEDAAHKADNQA